MSLRSAQQKRCRATSGSMRDAAPEASERWRFVGSKFIENRRHNHFIFDSCVDFLLRLMGAKSG